jgi:hypothetical protein
MSQAKTILSGLAVSLALMAPALAEGRAAGTTGGVTITRDGVKPSSEPTCPGNVCPGDITIVFPSVSGCTNPKDPKTGKYSMDCSKAKMTGGTSRQKAKGTFSMDKGGNVTFTPD